MFFHIVGEDYSIERLLMCNLLVEMIHVIWLTWSSQWGQSSSTSEHAPDPAEARTECEVSINSRRYRYSLPGWQRTRTRDQTVLNLIKCSASGSVCPSVLMCNVSSALVSTGAQGNTKPKFPFLLYLLECTLLTGSIRMTCLWVMEGQMSNLPQLQQNMRWKAAMLRSVHLASHRKLSRLPTAGNYLHLYLHSRSSSLRIHTQ